MGEFQVLDDRLAEEVGHLSTKLVTAVNKQVELEETILSLRKTVNALKQENATLVENDRNYRIMLPKYIKLQEDNKESNELRHKAEVENSKLSAEVEDLTASLFNEANNMVSEALRETHNYKVKNRKLKEELDEKDRVIEDLQEQLRDLKEMFVKIENQQRLSVVNTPRIEQSLFSFDQISTTTTTVITTGNDTGNMDSSDNPQNDGIHQNGDTFYHWQQIQSIIYSPQVNAIRLDLNNYKQDFKQFVYTLINPNFQFDLIHLKTLPFFKKIWHDELENSLSTIPALPNSSALLNRWQKGKTFWGSMIDGRVSIEPIKGINESFKLTYRGSIHSNSPPVAIQDPCSFCEEDRTDSLEHCRLYYLKIYESHNNEDLLVSYPLCNYCVIKLRNLCDFFAKLRLIKSNVFKLSAPTMAVPANSSGIHSNSTETIVIPKEISADEQSKLIKIYIMLILIRVKLFWSKVGFWDNINQLHEINLDEINYEGFSYLIPKTPVEVPGVDSNRDSINQTPIPLQPTEEEQHKLQEEGDEHGGDEMEVTRDRDEFEQKEDNEVEGEHVEEVTSEPKNGENSVRNEDNENKSDEDVDNKPDKGVDEEMQSEEGLGRSNSRSKEFREKLDNDLDKTLEMIAENLENH